MPGKARPKTMNQKKAKAIRRYARSLGFTKADLPAPRTGVMGYTDPVTGQSVRYDMPMTATYPATAFQRVCRIAKVAFARLSVAEINARAAI